MSMPLQPYYGCKSDYSVGSNFFKNIAHRLPIFSNPGLRVFSKYILAVMADESDEEIQIMEGFTSTSDSDNRSCESIIWQNGMFDYLHTHLNSYTV
jgi:hypothetical protein